MTSIAAQTNQDAAALIRGIFGNNPPKETPAMEPVAPAVYSRKTFDVEAVLVTEENIDAVASWVKGRVMAMKATEEHPHARYFVHVPVKRPLNDRQSQAFVGDWVLKARSGFKVYTERAFRGCFVEKKES